MKSFFKGNFPFGAPGTMPSIVIDNQLVIDEKFGTIVGEGIETINTFLGDIDHGVKLISKAIR